MDVGRKSFVTMSIKITMFNTHELNKRMRMREMILLTNNNAIKVIDQGRELELRSYVRNTKNW